MADKKKTSAVSTKAQEKTFTCKFCGKTKPISEMTAITRFFPPAPSCKECRTKQG